MSLILNIDTSLDSASVSIAKDGIILASVINNIQKEHATFLHTAIENMLSEAAIKIKQLDAIAVTDGPGSYTGLRVGMASAKGLCYALNLPLITVGTLKAMAMAAIEVSPNEDSLYCPMIDARRMEVFTAIYDNNMKEVFSPAAVVVDENSFIDLLRDNHILFFGNGIQKWRLLVHHDNAGFTEHLDVAPALAKRSFQKLINKEISDLIYTEPRYLKEFYNP